MVKGGMDLGGVVVSVTDFTRAKAMVVWWSCWDV